MQGACLALLLVATLLPVAGAVPLSFDTPAQAEPTLHASHAQWALLLFHSTSAAASLRTDGDGTYTNSTWAWQQDSYIEHVVSVAFPYSGEVRDESAPLPRGLVESLAFTQGWGSLYVEADSIALNLTGTEGRITPHQKGELVHGLLPTGYEESALHPVHGLATNQAVVGIRPIGQTAIGFTLAASGLHLVEWHGAQASCASDTRPCPAGGGTTKIPLVLPTGDRQNTSLESYSAVAALGRLLAEGTTVLGALGSDALDLETVGQVRLPLARLEGACPGCLDPGSRTLTANGTTTLRGLSAQPGAGGRMHSEVEGLQAVRLDETGFTLARLALPAAATGAAVLAAIVAIRWLAVLFSRPLDPEATLELPARRALYEAIQSHPGAMYRFLMDAAGQADGATRHHLKVLEKAGLIVSERHRRSVRYFENHGRYRHNWRHVAVLRDDELRRLLDWLKANPAAPQREVVQHAQQAWGLNRSATQRRLATLVGWGLLSAHELGRDRVYKVRFADAK